MMPEMTMSSAVRAPYDVIVRIAAETVDALGKMVVSRPDGGLDHSDTHVPNRGL